MYCKSLIISTTVFCLWENLLICKFAFIKFSMYFLFDCYLFMYVHIFACLHEICFYYIFIFFPYLNKNLVVNGKKNSTWFDRCNAFIRVQLLAIIFQVSVFLLWELYSFHDTNRTSSKDQNPTCKHAGQRKGWGMGVGSVIYICIYLDLCLLQFHQIIALIMKLPSAVILGTVKADLSFFDFRLQWVKIMWLLSPQRNKSTPGGQGTKVSWVTGIRRVKWNPS